MRRQEGLRVAGLGRGVRPRVRVLWQWQPPVHRTLQGPGGHSQTSQPSSFALSKGAELHSIPDPAKGQHTEAYGFAVNVNQRFGLSSG